MGTTGIERSSEGARGLPLVWHEAYEADIGTHVFPTAKYRLVLERLREEGLGVHLDLHRPEPAMAEEVGRVHTARWLRKLEEDDLTMAERMTLEVPWSASLARASWLCAGGSTLAGRLALAYGVAVHLGGGFHHAFADHGEGFCAIHDVAVAIRALLAEGAIERAMVIDLDVHHGNGTAAIFAGDPAVFTLSFHQEHNYPFLKPPGDLDVGFENGAGDVEYLAQLDEHVPAALDGHQPELVFYLAGADPYEEDTLGGLRLTREGLRERDERVLQALTAREIPGAVCLAGGYAMRREDTVAIHAGTAQAAMEALGST